VDWYNERNPTAAEAFAREIRIAFDLIASAPARWPEYEGSARRYLLSKFPYSVIYRVTASGVEIVAVAHHKRRPRYWLDR
jgi:plasmid stabilization system protein ParE